MAQLPKNFRPEPYDYHQELTLRIDNLSGHGAGVARDNGWVVFVPHALPGETVRARIFRNHKNHSEADCMEVIEPAADRVEPKCRLFGTCGGCQYQHLDYDSQLTWKQRHVADCLSRIAGLETAVETVAPSPRRYAYRSKLTPHFDRRRAGVIGPIGFLKRGSSRHIIDVEQCPIATDAVNAELKTVRDYIRSSWGKRQGGTLLLRDTDEGVTTNPNATVMERVGEARFRFKAGDFFQNNSFLLPEMVAHVTAQATGRGQRFLVDAYCGGGLFCISAARHFEQCVGIEISADAVKLAQGNAEFNETKNCTFVLGSAAEIFGRGDYSGAETAMIVDPPRKGCDDEFLKQAFAFGAQTIVYVSCDPATLARDLKAFAENGYELTHMKPFDMFPQTRHIECIATMQRSA